VAGAGYLVATRVAGGGAGALAASGEVQGAVT
jgi:hypothetical protein